MDDELIEAMARAIAMVSDPQEDDYDCEARAALAAIRAAGCAVVPVEPTKPIPDRYKSHTPAQALGHMIEECGEVLAAAGKTVRFGWQSYNPEIPEAERETNEDWLMREIADLERAIAALKSRIVAAQEAKP